MKVLGFVIIVFGFIFIWIGISGDQHNLMAVLKGQANPAPTGQTLNPSGTGNASTTSVINNGPGVTVL